MDSKCSKCGVALAPSDVLYASDASVVCAACADKADLVDTDKRAAANIKAAAYSSLTAGAFGLVFNPIWVCTVIAATSGVFAMRSLLPGNERFSKHLGDGGKTVVWICAGGGIGLAGLHVLLMLAAVSLLGR